VSNAERTLNDFLDFLKNDKYKAWNQDQINKREALLKSMIGKEWHCCNCKQLVMDFKHGAAGLSVIYRRD
jgi:hypothetical protein